ncbi:dienelactone hydrolase family protein [Propionispira raffinosivorans]|uniref:dienelactone hydrolase family protein n=1 Tax=Propionispira raffinosivorans TaxID=86959 RepID=UPI000372D7E9|nr:alpha/beta fold hydrolase [Propionispira raffinosivorans]
MKKICSILLVACFFVSSFTNASTRVFAQAPVKEMVDGDSSAYQTNGVISKQNLPVFYEKLKAKLTYPMSWNSGKYLNFKTWKSAAKARVMAALPTEKTVPFDARVIAEEDRGTYIAQKIAFNITPESRVLALFLIPKGKGPFPAAVLLHDHGAKFDIGKEKLIRSWGDSAKDVSAQLWVQKYFSGRFIGDEMAKRGYAVIAVDALGWGDRGPLKSDDQQALASNMFNLGSSLGGLMAYEDIRTVDFLTVQPQIDKKKVVAVGFSMGAYRAWQLAALSDKIKAGASICWMAEDKGLMTPGNNQLKGQSAFQMMLPGVINYLDYPDVASLAAPKAMLFYDGSDDGLFPTIAVQAAYDTMRKVWKSQQADNKLETKIWPGLGHVFVQAQQEAVFDWLDRQIVVK